MGRTLGNEFWGKHACWKHLNISCFDSTLFWARTHGHVWHLTNPASICNFPKFPSPPRLDSRYILVSFSCSLRKTRRRLQLIIALFSVIRWIFTVRQTRSPPCTVSYTGVYLTGEYASHIYRHRNKKLLDYWIFKLHSSYIAFLEK